MSLPIFTYAESKIPQIFEFESGHPKVGKINGLNYLSYVENGEPILFLFDKGVEIDDDSEYFWYLSCQKVNDSTNLEKVLCGLNKDGFLILKSDLGLIIQLENKPQFTGKYNIAFDKNPTFQSNFRIIDQKDVKNFLSKMFAANKMQFSVKNPEGEYVRKSIDIQNAQLALSLLTEIYDFY